MNSKPFLKGVNSDSFYEKDTLNFDDNDEYNVKIFDKEQLLHRYRNINEYTLSDLLNDKITFASPDLFNDPYDSSYMYKPNLKVSTTMVYKPNGGKEVEVKGNKGRLMPHGERIIDNVLQPFLKKYTLVACLSENNANEVMWSHYANQAKGIVLSYSINQLEDLMKRESITNYVLTPIFYEDYKLYFNPFSKKSDEEKMHFYMNKVMKLKNKYWSYEEEWRLIFSSINEERFSNKYVSLEGIKPSKIFLGEKIDPTYARIIKDIAKNKDIQVFKAFSIQKSNNRELAFEQVF